MSANIVESTTWQPDWATHPGEHLAEYLEDREMSQVEFARLVGMVPELVSTIIARSSPVTPEMALKFKQVLGLEADIWLSIQARWELYEIREKVAEEASMPEDNERNSAGDALRLLDEDLSRRGSAPVLNRRTEPMDDELNRLLDEVVESRSGPSVR